MKYQITATGQALFESELNGVMFTRIEFGSGFNYLPAQDPTGLQGGLVYTLNNQVPPVIVDANTLKYTIYLAGPVASFSFGEIAVYSEDDLLMVGASPTLINKVGPSSGDVGLPLAIELFVPLTGDRTYITSDLNHYGDKAFPSVHVPDLLKPPAKNGNNAYVVNGLNQNDPPYLAFSDGTGKWAFSSKTFTYISGEVISVNALGMHAEIEGDYEGNVKDLVLQFVTGKLRGYCRVLNAHDGNGNIQWNTPFLELPSPGDEFIIQGPAGYEAATLPAFPNRRILIGGPEGEVVWSDNLQYDPDTGALLLSGSAGVSGQVLTSGGPGEDIRWATPTPGGGGSGGEVNTEEILLEADPITGEVVIDGLLGNHFRLIPTRAVKLMNPINFSGAAVITIAIVVDSSGAYPITWDLDWAFEDSIAPGFATTIGAINLLRARLTDGDTWITDVSPNKSIVTGYGKVRPIARIGSTDYYMMSNPTNTGALNMLTKGGTVEQNTVLILRNGKSSEVTGTIVDDQGGHYLVAGLPLGGTGEQRPVLQLLKTEYGEGPPRGPNRPSFGRQLIGVDGTFTVGAPVSLTAEFRDFRVTGSRNDGGNGRGLGQNGQSALTLRNLLVYDNNNGILIDNNTQGPLTIIDCVFDANGVGSPNNVAAENYNSAGFVHNVYAGRNNQVLTLLRSTFSNCVTGHNLKCRNATIIMDQVICYNSLQGREFDIPNGTALIARNCVFYKEASAGQNNLIQIGSTFDYGPNVSEGINSNRARSYVFENCLFVNLVDPGRDTSFVVNKDPDVSVQYIDCQWTDNAGGTLAKTYSTPRDTGDSNYLGLIMTEGDMHLPGRAPIKTFTGGPIGPLPSKPPGYQPIPMTPPI